MRTPLVGRPSIGISVLRFCALLHVNTGKKVTYSLQASLIFNQDSGNITIV